MDSAIVSKIKYVNWSKNYGGCINSGFAALIDDKYFYGETTSYGRLLN